MKEMFLLRTNLTLFEGGAAAGGASAGGTGGDGGAAQGGTNAAPGSARRGSGDLSNVVYGKQPEDSGNNAPAAGENKADVSTTSDTLEARKAAYQQFLTENKDLDDQRIQGIINKRFKEYKTLQETVDKNQSVIDMLNERYGITDGNVDSLRSAIENDDAYWADAADEAGMSISQYKEVMRLKRENAQLVKQQQIRLGKEQAERQVQTWQAEGEALKAKFPGFNLAAEFENPQFKALLRANVPMEQAYKVIHMDALMNDAVGNAASAAEKRVVDNVRARGTRPAENGAASQSPFTVKSDVTKLTKKDRAEIAKRAARGDIISF